MDAGNLIILTGLGIFLVPELFVLGLFELFEITLVVSKFGVLEVNDLLDSGVQKVTSMGHNNDAAVQFLNVVFEPN